MDPKEGNRDTEKRLLAVGLDTLRLGSAKMSLDKVISLIFHRYQWTARGAIVYCLEWSLVEQEGLDSIPALPRVQGG